MKIITFIMLAFIVLASVFSGCTEKVPGETPVPTATPAGTERFQPPATPAIPTLTPTPFVELQTTYIVWIDSDYGFYKVRAVRGISRLSLPHDLDILNISINAGDKIRWMNDDSYDFPLTLVSNEGLWTGRAGYMRWQGARFVYRFNERGRYMFSIKEYPVIQNQTIIVN